ncbi:Hsp33 family molecular chaperone HslO [Candidiatus Paracoxiella cheracis]|uniref:Hsp33 family molecular chaperone HslO n=1 Tax=Candidiatus Paracoxiella cheracis TaxID=3405120 RepID=UPI003BF55137
MFKCSCSLKKMENAIFTMGKKEADLILNTNPEIWVTCEYCNNQYGFDRNAVSSIFSDDTIH